MPPSPGLIALIEKQGSTVERQLVKRWRTQIEGFLTAFSGGIQAGEQRLELGLENALVLKLVVKRAALPPAAGLIRIAASLPPVVASIGRQAISQGLKFHVGLRVQADACHREIYVYEREHIVARILASHGVALPAPPNNMVASFYGIDETAGISAYFTDPENPAIRAYAEALAARISHELRYDIRNNISGLWDHMRLRGGKWHPSKFGFELKEVPVELATRIISHYRPPHFRYLIPFQPYHSIVIAGSIETGIAGWYFNF